MDKTIKNVIELIFIVKRDTKVLLFACLSKYLVLSSLFDIKSANFEKKNPKTRI